jgi:hypothetical protein
VVSNQGSQRLGVSASVSRHCTAACGSTPPASTPRDVVGDQTYESLARDGEVMTTAEMATYAYDQIDQVRQN